MNPARLHPRRGPAVLVLAAAALLAGCSAAASPATPTPAGAAGATPGASAPAGRPSDLPIKVPPLATVPSTAQPIMGEAPAELISAARADLAGRVTTTAATGAAVVRSEAVAWPDGSLGCRVPGEFYPQVVTPGYWIVLAVDGKEYDYRATETGRVHLCKQALKPNPGG